MATCSERAGWHGAITYRRSDGVTVACSGSVCAVYEVGTANLVTIYSNHTGTPKANPIVLDENGQADFYVGQADCIFDLYVTSPAGAHAPFRRRSQTAWFPDLSPWPYDKDADAHGLTRLSHLFEGEVVVCVDQDLASALTQLTAAGGRGAIICPPGDYACPNGGYDVTNGRTIQDLLFLGYGPDTRFYPSNAANTGPLLYMASGGRTARYVFRDFRLDGLDSATIGEAAIAGGDAGLLHVKRADDVTIESIWAHDVAGDEADLIRVGHHTVSGDYVTACNLRDLHLSNAHRNGVSIIAGIGVTLADSEFHDCDTFAAEVEPNDIGDAGVNENSAADIVFQNLRAYDGDTNFRVDAHFGVIILDNNKDVDHQNYSLKGCQSHSAPGAGFAVIGAREVTFEDCHCDEAEQSVVSAAAGWLILGVTNCWLRGCSSNRNAQSHGARVGPSFGGYERGCWGVFFEDYVARGNVGNGIRYQEGTGITEDNHNSTVTGGVIYDNGQPGICVDSSCVGDTLRLTVMGVHFDSNEYPIEFENPCVVRGFLYVANTSIAHTGAGGTPNRPFTSTGTFSVYKVISATNETGTLEQ